MSGMRDFPGGLVIGTLPSNVSGALESLQSLVSELRSLQGQKIQNIKKKNQYHNKLNKDFKNGPHQKNLKKKKRMSGNNISF